MCIEGPNSIAKEFSGPLQDLDHPKPYEDREAFFNKLAYAQWNEEEIAAGLPFEHLLR